MFRVALFANTLNQLIHIANMFSVIKDNCIVKFFLILGFMQYWLSRNCCREIGLNGVLEMSFLLKNKIIFALVYHWFIIYLWFNIATEKSPISPAENQIRTPHWQHIHHQVEGMLLTQQHRDVLCSLSHPISPSLCT